MSFREIVKVVAAILTCAAILSIAVLWNDMPGSVVECPPDDPTSPTADPALEPYTIRHCTREVPASERIIKIVVAITALGVLSFVVVRLARKAPVWAAVASCVVSSVVSLLALGYLYGRIHGRWLIPDALPLLIVCSTAALLGAIASWAALKWWPNTSLERTRGR